MLWITQAVAELLLTVLLGLYPREWRNRYGEEVRELITVLSEQDRRSLVGMMPSLIVGATTERWYACRRSDRARIAAVTAATVVLLGGTVVLSHRVETRRALASTRPLPRGRGARVARARGSRRLLPDGGSSGATPPTGDVARARSTL